MTLVGIAKPGAGEATEIFLLRSGVIRSGSIKASPRWGKARFSGAGLEKFHWTGPLNIHSSKTVGGPRLQNIFGKNKVIWGEPICFFLIFQIIF